MDECVADVQAGRGLKIQSLGNLFRSVGMINKENSLLALSSPLTSAGMTLSWFSTSGVMSLLLPDIRQKYERMLDQSGRELVEILRSLKNELCVRRKERPSEIVSIIARLDALWIRLEEEINLLKVSQPELES